VLFQVNSWKDKQGNWVSESQYTLPVERSPELWAEALTVAEENELDARRVYFRPGVGWIACCRGQLAGTGQD
jgi:hypothetical protein